MGWPGAPAWSKGWSSITTDHAPDCCDRPRRRGRATGVTNALARGAGMVAVDACWEELRRQAEDGTARAWLGLCAAGLIPGPGSDAGFEGAARQAVLDGCAAALAAGAPLA